MKAVIIFVMHLLLPFLQANAQEGDLFHFSGTVFNKETHDAIPYANIYIEDTGIGTVSNTEGKFQLYWERKFHDRVLVISCIGFDRQEIPLPDIGDKAELQVGLTESATFLKEVLIKDEDASAIMRSALRNLSRNYEAPAHRMEAFYRTSMKDDESVTRLLEASVLVTDPQGKFHGKRDIEVRSIRKANDLRKDKWKTYDGYLTHLVRNHPLQSRAWDFMHPGGLDKFSINIYDIKYQDNELYYILSLAPKRPKLRIQYEALVTVDDKDHAIHEIIIKWKPEFGNYYSWAWEQRDSARFKAHWQESHYTFQKVDDKYYLKSAQWHRKGNVIAAKGDTLFSNESLDELIVVKIEKGMFEARDNASHTPDVYVLATQIPYDPSFWKKYNRPVDSRYFKEAKKAMEKSEPLEQQFIRNSGLQPDPVSDGKMPTKTKAR